MTHQTRSIWQIPILIFLLLALSACTETAPSGAISRSSDGTIPSPSSTLMAGFVQQTDGLYGYRILRPANWESVDSGDARQYATPGFRDTTDRILIRVVNLQAYHQSLDGSSGVNAMLASFEKDPSLEGWTAGIEQIWQSNGIGFTLLGSLSQAKLYSIELPGSSEVNLVAYAVDQEQPLALQLTGSGAYADLERLRDEGILDDFEAMAASAQAITQDPQNIDPPLE